CSIRAFRVVQDAWPDASLTLVGSGRHEPALRQLASDLRLRNVTFAGRVSPGEIAGWYASHDIYLQSPDIDNMPLSVLEAFASGLPVVSTDVGGVPALVDNGRTGLLAPAREPAPLARQVLWLLDHPGDARQMAAAARASCEPYGWKTVREQWLDAYRPVTAGPEATRWRRETA